MVVTITALREPRIFQGVNAVDSFYEPLVLEETPYSAIWNIGANPDLYEYICETNDLTILKKLLSDRNRSTQDYLCAEVIRHEDDFFLEMTIMADEVEFVGLLGESFYDMRITSDNQIKRGHQSFSGVTDYKFKYPKSCWHLSFKPHDSVESIYKTVMHKIQVEKDAQDQEFYTRPADDDDFYFRQRAKQPIVNYLN